MFGGTENFMTMRCVRNKLRKRDDTPSPIIQEKAARLDMNFDRTLANYNCTCQHGQIPNTWDVSSNDNIARGFSLEKNMFVEHKRVSFVRTSGIQMANVIMPSDINPINTKWVFPPKAPTPNICNCLNDVSNKL
ncbi:PREDICTED: uncharacterized protein LOC108357056 [Rhagoletis zephyria]|uniref:uncharacterized protein LOC108357056 n=1 Tax=Rhagoletis zephyria TaxID=28612 RepID=UPI000811A90C|nr:PREDICTED: uncharacterized protein LOC108357056 [Rhagoletis zephyria]